MDISTRIRRLRAERGWSQEQLAEKLGVSRQAVTKWETDAGAPDIENLAALARAFGVSADDLLGEGAGATSGGDRFESVTAIDLDAERNYDIDAGYARLVTLRAVEGCKLAVRLSSRTIADIDRAVKVLLDTGGRSLDIELSSTGVVADELLRRELDVEICVPAELSATAEIACSAAACVVEGARMDLEVGGQIGRVALRGVEGHVELDLAGNAEIWAHDVRGQLDVNQMGAASVLHVPASGPFAADTKGRLGRRTLRFAREGEPCEAPDMPEDAPLRVQLSGARVELTVDATARAIPSGSELVA